MKEFKPYDRAKYDLDPRSDEEVLLQRESTLIYFQPLRDCREVMTREQKGHLLDLMMDWAEFEKEPDFEGDMAVQIAFNNFRSQERINRTKYLKKARNGKQAVEKRERKKAVSSEENLDADSG